MAATWQTVRVFISSTFRDMHSERDWLVKVVFPELRERLEKHRIHLVDIDLRWGVTEDQANNDQALDLCLDLIDECRPFFIGILGERYGWVPETFPDPAVAKYGWIQGMTGKSITALEIAYGVLNEPEMRDHSFFYFRDPSFISTMPAWLRGQMEAESPESAAKLVQLKDEIRAADLPVTPMENYPCQCAGLRVMRGLAKRELGDADSGLLDEITAEGIVDPHEYEALDPRLREIVERYGVVHLTGLQEFGNRVREDLWNGFCQQFPELLMEEAPRPAEAAAQPQTPVEWLAEEQDYHERFIESRTQVYIGRQAIHDELMTYLASDETVPVIVSGPSGSGKSAILARLYNEAQARGDLGLVIGHFVGASPQSTSLPSMLRRFCLELRERFSLVGASPPPPYPRACCGSFWN